MIRFACPKCEKRFSVDDAKAGALASCAACGHQFRVPSAASAASARTPAAAAKKTSPESRREPPQPAPSRAAVDDDGSFGFAKESEPAPPKVEKKRRRPDPEDDEPDEPAESKPKKKKKKKKQEEEKAGGIPPMLIIGGVFAAVAVLGLGIFLIFKVFDRPPLDPAQAIALLKAKEVLIQQDPTSPDQAVIAVNFANLKLIKSDDLDALRAFPKLKRLELVGTNIKHFHLQQLGLLTSLEYLDLSHTDLAGSFDELKPLVNMKELHLANTLVRDDQLEHLKTMTKLEKIGLSGCVFATGRGLKEHLPNLKIIGKDENNPFAPPISF